MADTVMRSSAHDRGTLLTQVAMMIAAGGRCLSDLKTLRDQPVLFGEVASDATVWRAMHQVDDEHLQALGSVRQQACARLLAQGDEPLVLDIDASLVAAASDDKQGAAANFKGGWGFHPMLCFIEPLGVAAGMLRPGNANANTIADQIAVLDQAIGSLPEVWQHGHRPGDDPAQVTRVLRVRADTAAGGPTMLKKLAERNLVFSVGMRVSDDACTAIRDIDESVWQPAVNVDGQPREGAQVCEAPALVPPAHRREPGRSCVGNGPTRERRCGCGTTTGCATRSPSPTTRIPTSWRSSGSTVSTPRSRTGSSSSRTADSTGCR
jgi:hypothetical protein